MSLGSAGLDQVNGTRSPNFSGPDLNQANPSRLQPFSPLGDVDERHRSAGVSATGLTAATPSRPAPSTMAPSHPRPKPTPKPGSVSVDVIRPAIRKATGLRRRGAK